jgi:geranylgeranyl reductase family protein
VADESYVTPNVIRDVWDAMVVGAGPAGCAAAYDLALAGQSVLLLDKRDFPRPKACAGGLTTKAVKTLRYSIEPVVRAVIRRVQLENEGSSTSLRSREPICVMTVRAEFDEYCLGKTIAAGANFRKISTVREIRRDESGVQLTTADATHRARFLIGADGASGQVRRLCGEGTWFSQGFALEVQTSMPEGEVDLTFDFGSVPQGYAWVFPKGNHLNVGIYSQSCEAGLTRSGLLRYVKQRLGVDAADHVTGQYLGMGAESCGVEYVRADLRDRVLLVGDAGGFVDPLTGEGIYGALLSGQAAASAVLSELRGEGAVAEQFAGSVRGYRQTLRFSARAAGAFYRNPERGFRAMRLPLVRRTMVRTYTDGLNVNSLAMRIALSRC